MNRRVALARAIALDPEMVMYDEPFVGQDPIAMGVLVGLIRKLNQALSITSVVVSHDLHETAQISDYLYVLAMRRSSVKDLAGLDGIRRPSCGSVMNGHADGPVPFHYPADDYKEALLRECE